MPLTLRGINPIQLYSLIQRETIMEMREETLWCVTCLLLFHSCAYIYPSVSTRWERESIISWNKFGFSVPLYSSEHLAVLYAHGNMHFSCTPLANASKPSQEPSEEATCVPGRQLQALEYILCMQETWIQSLIYILISWASLKVIPFKERYSKLYTCVQVWEIISLPEKKQGMVQMAVLQNFRSNCGFVCLGRGTQILVLRFNLDYSTLLRDCSLQCSGDRTVPHSNPDFLCMKHTFCWSPWKWFLCMHHTQLIFFI